MICCLTEIEQLAFPTQQKKPERTLACQSTFFGMTQLIAYDRAAMLGDHDVNAMTTALELVGQDFSS